MLLCSFRFTRNIVVGRALLQDINLAFPISDFTVSAMNTPIEQYDRL